jgi:hypothetical protein
MQEIMRWSAPVFLFVGTAGLLLNEFIFDWGTSATLVFAVLNFLGLIQLVVTYRRRNLAEG